MHLQKVGIVVMFLLCVFMGSQYGYKKYDQLSRKNTEKEDGWIHKILEDTKKEGWINEDVHIETRKLEGDFIGDEALDQIWILQGKHKKETLLALYENKHNAYQYVSCMEIMGELKAIQPMKMKGIQKDLLVIEEYMNQLLGSFEETTWIKVYDWRTKKVLPVLTLIEEYHAYWNELWDGKKPKKESRWLQMAQKSYIQWENDFYPIVHVVSHQNFSASKDRNQIEMPLEDNFQVEKTREIKREYYWNPNWNAFILGEGIDQKTGEKVAILEDLSDNPFTLVGYEEEMYRIKRASGQMEEVPKNEIISNKMKKDVQVSLNKNKAASSKMKNCLAFYLIT